MLTASGPERRAGRWWSWGCTRGASRSGPIRCLGSRAIGSSGREGTDALSWGFIVPIGRHAVQ